MSKDSQLLKIQDLYACIDDTSILKGINLEIKPGEIHAIMGKMGVEKLLLQILSWDILIMK